MKKSKKLFINLIFALAVLAIAAVLFAMRNKSSGSKLEAQLTYGTDNKTMVISLDKDAEYDVDTGLYTVHIQVQDGAARFINSPCPDHICESYGWISQEDQTAVCMPALAVLTIAPVS